MRGLSILYNLRQYNLRQIPKRAPPPFHLYHGGSGNADPHLWITSHPGCGYLGWQQRLKSYADSQQPWKHISVSKPTQSSPCTMQNTPGLAAQGRGSSANRLAPSPQQELPSLSIAWGKPIPYFPKGTYTSICGSQNRYYGLP
eukprot:scaffold635975_cov17-Prasinocladus_malaysianus.AAC.1